MKIAYVLHHLNMWGGQERSTSEVINRLVERHEVHVFCYSVEGLDKRVTFHKVPLIIRKPFFLKDFFFRILVGLMLLRYKFDIINATGNCCFQANTITVQFCQKRWNLERKKLEPIKNLRWYLAEFQSWYDVTWEKIVFNLRREKLYIAIAHQVYSDLKKYFGIKNIEVIHHGVNLQEFSANSSVRDNVRQLLDVKKDEILFLFVGTFERKGLYFLLPAFARLCAEFKVKLCVVGLGSMPRAQGQAEALKIADKVKFVGHVKNPSQYYQASDVFILPSLYDTFGLVGIEALASGLPTVVSKQSGVSELIETGYNGYIIDQPNSSESIYQNLKAILENNAGLEKLKQHARQSVVGQSWDEVAKKYEAAFLKFLEHQ